MENPKDAMDRARQLAEEYNAAHTPDQEKEKALRKAYEAAREKESDASVLSKLEIAHYNELGKLHKMCRKISDRAARELRSNSEAHDLFLQLTRPS
jgi:DNA-directed RNA polymerase subunit K/omega